MPRQHVEAISHRQVAASWPAAAGLLPQRGVSRTEALWVSRVATTSAVHRAAFVGRTSLQFLERFLEVARPGDRFIWEH